ncbi:MAG: chlorohydrolase, partial [Opitutaceae bacterium]
MDAALLVENATLLSPGGTPTVRRGCSIVIEDGRISRVLLKSRVGKFTGRRIDAAGKVVTPGLINAHTHFYSSFARGLTKVEPAKDFMGVLRNLWWRLDSALTIEDC